MFEKYLPLGLTFLMNFFKKNNNRFQSDVTDTLNLIRRSIQSEILLISFKILIGILIVGIILISVFGIFQVIAELSLSSFQGLLISVIGYFLVILFSIIGLFLIFKRNSVNEPTEYSLMVNDYKNKKVSHLFFVFINGIYNGYSK